MASKTLSVGWSMVGFLLVAGRALASPDVPSAAAPESSPIDPRIAVTQHLGVEAFTIQQLQLPDQAVTGFTVGIDLGGRRHELGLVPYSLRGFDFQVLVQGADGDLSRAVAPPPRTVRGDIALLPGSRVRGSVVSGGLQAIVTTPEGESWDIRPLRLVVAGADPRSHIVYRSGDAPAHEGVCGNAEAVGPQGSPVAPRGGVNRVCDIAFDVDREYFLLNGSDIESVINDIEFIMNAVEGQYELNTGTTFELTTFVIRTAEPDPYTVTESGAVCNEIAAEWNANLGAIRRDVAHLFTGKDIDGGVIGRVLNIGTICLTSVSYGFSQSRFTNDYVERVALTSHELGHNFSATHCNSDPECRIMCSGVGACFLPPTYFSDGEVGQIEPFVDGRFCTVPVPAPVSPPFSDSFPVSDVSVDRWIYQDGAYTSGDSMNPPSPPWALELNSLGDRPFQDDEIRTAPILLGAVSGIRLEYSLQSRGVPPGGQIFVDGLARYIPVPPSSQPIPWSDRFDSYPSGSSLHGLGGWHGWDGAAGAGAPTNSSVRRSAPNSVAISGAADLVHEYAGISAGEWVFTAWQYVPAAFSGTSYFILLNTYADGGPYDWSVQLRFDGAAGTVTDDFRTGDAVSLVRNSWAQIRIEFDLSANTVSQFYNGTRIATGAWTTGPDSLREFAAVDLFANGSGLVYYDDMSLVIPYYDWVGIAQHTSGGGDAEQFTRFSHPIGGLFLHDKFSVRFTADVDGPSQTWFVDDVFVGVPCPCDWNDDAILNSQDLFDYLTDFFAGNADFNGFGGTNSQDFFDYLVCFFTGCD